MIDKQRKNRQEVMAENFKFIVDYFVLDTKAQNQLMNFLDFEYWFLDFLEYVQTSVQNKSLLFCLKYFLSLLYAFEKSHGYCWPYLTFYYI